MIIERYRIADQVVEIRSLHSRVHRLCADYRTEDPADYSVSICQEDIEAERKRSSRACRVSGAPVSWSDAYLEELAVYRKMADHLLSRDILLFHGSCLCMDGVGYLFAAPSGTGKSTHSRLWREVFGDRVTMVNDDKPLLHIGETVTAYGTPWNGKERQGNNMSVPLRAICLLERAEENRIEPVSASGVFAPLLQQVYRPGDPEALARSLALFWKLLARVRLYRLGCNMDRSAAELAFRVMSEDAQTGGIHG